MPDLLEPLLMSCHQAQCGSRGGTVEITGTAPRGWGAAGT